MEQNSAAVRKRVGAGVAPKRTWRAASATRSPINPWVTLSMGPRLPPSPSTPVPLEDSDTELHQLLRRHAARRVAHQIGGLLGLREGDDIAEALALRQQHHQAIHAEGDAAVGRRAELQGVEEEAELLPGLLFTDAEGAEHLLLHDGIVETDRAAGDLEAVEHEFVAIAEDLPGVLVDQAHAVVVGAREGVMPGGPALVLVVVLEERRLHDPQEVPLAAVTDLGDVPELLAQEDPQVGHDRVDQLGLARLEQDQIP